MIFKSQSSVSPKIEIAISGVPVNYLSLQRISMSLHENQHDLVKIAMSGVPSGLINDYVDAPVSISWYQGSAGHEFRGYIVFVEPEHINRMGMVNDSPLQQVVLTCFGASFDMRGKRVQVWESPTLYSIVDKLSKKYKFSYSIPNSTFKYIRLTQHNESDWEFLARVVDDLGYSMAFHGTHLHVWDRHRSLGRQTSLHKLESLGTNSDVMETPGRILSFKAYIGAVTPSGNINSRRVVSLDTRGVVTTIEQGDSFTGTGKAIGNRFTDEIAMNVVSPYYAEQSLQAQTRKKFPHSAVVEIIGSAGIKPGGIVDIKKFNGKFDGLWYVASAEHTITRHLYTTELHLLKDTTNESPVVINPVTSFNTSIPNPVLVGSNWRAATQMEEQYA